jgi:hypothetical protein
MKLKIKTAGGCPAASYFSCLAKKSNQKKSPPVCRRFAVPLISRKQAGLRNSTSRLRRSGLEQCSPETPLACS